MSDSTSDLGALSPSQEKSILELGSHGSSGLLDPDAMCELFMLGMVAVSNVDRRVVLTNGGRRAYVELAARAPTCLTK